MDSEIIINSYKNEPSVTALIKLIATVCKSKFVAIGWQVHPDTYYVAGILDVNINNVVNCTGWYLHEPLTDANIPITHSKFINHYYIYSGKCVILHANSVINVINAAYKFQIEAYVEKLYYLDVGARVKCNQETTLVNMAHAIRTPLNGVLHMSKDIFQMCSVGAPDSDALFSSLSCLNQSSAILASNIFDIIDLYKLELGKLQIINDLLDIRALVSDIIKNKSATLDHAVTINYHVDASVPQYIYSDAIRIKQILYNLLDNAIHHTEKGGIFLLVNSTIVNLAKEHGIESNLSTIQHEITFSIRDTGIGMTHAIREAVFKPPDVTRTKIHGVGLRISYLISKLLNGNISIIYSDPQSGTCVDFSIVTYEEDPPKFHYDTLKTLKGKKILYYLDPNDLPISNFLITSTLDKHNISYNKVSSTEEILTLHVDTCYDLYITTTTVNLPGPVLRIGVEPKTGEYSIDDMFTELNLEYKLIEIFTACNTNKDIHNCKIMIVEDEKINRIVIEKILRMLGYVNITMAHNGEHALNTLDATYELVISDLRMPGMSGFELADAIHERYPNIRMLGMTAQVLTSEILKPWFNVFIYKPIDYKELDKKITLSLSD